MIYYKMYGSDKKLFAAGIFESKQAFYGFVCLKTETHGKSFNLVTEDIDGDDEFETVLFINNDGNSDEKI